MKQTNNSNKLWKLNISCFIGLPLITLKVNLDFASVKMMPQ